MSTSDVLAKLPHLRGFKRKSKAKYKDLEFRIFVDPADDEGVYFTVENTKTKEILDVSNDYFYDFEKTLSDSLKKQVALTNAKTAAQYLEAYLKVVNEIPEQFVIAISTEIYSRSPWGSLGNIVKDAQKLLSAKTIEFQEGITLQECFTENYDNQISIIPKDCSEEFGDASFRIELNDLEHHSCICEIVTD